MNLVHQSPIYFYMRKNFMMWILDDNTSQLVDLSVKGDYPTTETTQLYPLVQSLTCV